MLDSDGIEMMAVPKQNGTSFRFKTTDNPTQYRNVKLDYGGQWTRKSQSAIRFIRFISNKVTDPTGAGSRSFRMHCFTRDKDDEDKQKYTWNNGAIENGYLTYPEDIKNIECTIICRVNNALDLDCVEMKLGGGQHSKIERDNRNHRASCYCARWFYESSIRKSVSFEFTHPIYEDHTPVKALNTYKPIRTKDGTTRNNWMGFKTVSYVTEKDGKPCRIIKTYFDEDPISSVNGKPRNNWKPYFEFVDTGNDFDTLTNKTTGLKYHVPHTWGGCINSIRIDWVESVDVAYFNYRSIEVPTP